VRIETRVNKRPEMIPDNQCQRGRNTSLPEGQQVDTNWEEKFWALTKSKNSLCQQLQNSDSMVKALNNRLAEANSTIQKLKKTQLFFMDWARQQEWELPPHIRDRLPKDKGFMIKAALEKVPKGNSPAEYSFNLLLFHSLPENEQVELGAKVFEREKAMGPYDFSQLKIVTDELHDMLFHFPDDDVRMIAEYAFLSSGVPRLSTDPESEWVRLKKMALELFPVYTRVTVKKCGYRSQTYSNLATSRKESRTAYYLVAERISKRARHWHGDNRLYRIQITYDADTRTFQLVEAKYKWEIANFGMADYKGEFMVTNLSMDNNPPYTDGMKGIVQILWTGVCIYDSAED